MVAATLKTLFRYNASHHSSESVDTLAVGNVITGN
jgi:hypothetical protein